MLGFTQLGGIVCKSHTPQHRLSKPLISDDFQRWWHPSFCACPVQQDFSQYLIAIETDGSSRGAASEYHIKTEIVWVSSLLHSCWIGSATSLVMWNQCTYATFTTVQAEGRISSRRSRLKQPQCLCKCHNPIYYSNYRALQSTETQQDADHVSYYHWHIETEFPMYSPHNRAKNISKETGTIIRFCITPSIKPSFSNTTKKNLLDDPVKRAHSFMKDFFKFSQAHKATGIKGMFSFTSSSRLLVIKGDDIMTESGMK